jgi:hypothetical protein
MALGADVLGHNTYCLENVSKNAGGEIVVRAAAPKSCGDPGCKSLTLVQALRVNLTSNPPCDVLGQVLDGVMQTDNLTTVFTGLSENLRGVHEANFSWNVTGGGVITGTLEGITNAGIVRPQPFKECERCDHVGVLTGHLFGTGANVPAISPTQFFIEAVYRLSWDPIAQIGGTAPVIGTFEGVTIVPCRKP